MRQVRDENLRLTGNNKDDLKVISAYLQDSLIAVRDIVFLKKNKTFIMIANRFMWEDIEKGIFRQNKRIRCAIKFEGIIKVKSKNINQKNKNKSLEFLAMQYDSSTEKDGKITIFFSGNSAIILIAEVIDIAMNDLGNPWKARYKPKHKI